MAVVIEEAVVKIQADMKGLQKDLKDVKTGLKDIGDEGDKAAAKTKNLGPAIKAGIAVGVVAIGAAVVKMSQLAAESVKLYNIQIANETKLEAVVKATGAAAGFTSEQLKRNAAALQQITTFGDETIIGMQAVLSTFREVKGDEFNRATKAALDMSTVLGTDLKSSALQLGKALNDPATGLTTLNRAGITFTEDQKNTIKTLQQTGDMAGAQGLILEELEKQFGGAAEAMSGTFAGASDQLSNTMGDLKEVIGGTIADAMLPLVQAAQKVFGGLSDDSSAITDFLMPAMEILINAFALGTKVMLGFVDAGQYVFQLGKLIFDALAVTALGAVELLVTGMGALLGVLGNLPGIAGEGFRAAAEKTNEFKDSITSLRKGAVDTAKETADGFAKIAESSAAAGNTIDQVAGDMVAGMQGANKSIADAHRARLEKGLLDEQKANSQSVGGTRKKTKEEIKAEEKAAKDRKKISDSLAKDTNKNEQNKYQYAVTQMNLRITKARAAGVDEETITRFTASEIKKIRGDMSRNHEDMSNKSFITSVHFNDKQLEDFIQTADEQSQKEKVMTDRANVLKNERLKREQQINDLMTSSSEAFATAVVKGGNVQKGVWDALGTSIKNSAAANIQTATKAMVKDLVAAAASSLGLGGGMAVAEGQAVGGWSGALAAVGKFAGSVVAGLAASRLVDQVKFADGGYYNAMGMTGRVNKGTGPRSDDVMARPGVLVSRGEYIVNAESTRKNLPLLERLNASKAKYADGGITGGIDAEGKAESLANGLLISSAIAFIEGWLEGGDQFTGIATGAMAAGEHAVTAGMSGLASKILAPGIASAFGYANGGLAPKRNKNLAGISLFPEAMKASLNASSGGDCGGSCSGGGRPCASCAKKKRANKALDKRYSLKAYANGGLALAKNELLNSYGFADGGFWSGHSPDDGHPGAGPSAGPDASYLYSLPMTERMRAIGEWQSDHGYVVTSGGPLGTIGDILPSDPLGILPNPQDCVDTLSNPRKIVDELWQASVEMLRAPLMQLSRDITSPDDFSFNPAAKIGNSFQDIIGAFDMKDVLGDCAPNIPGFAKGGVVTGPTMAMIGEGNDPGEAVMPLKRGKDGKLGVSGGGITVNVAGSVISEGELVDYIETALAKRDRISFS